MNRSSLFLMANLGSEISRLMSFRDKGDQTLMLQTFDRARSIIAEIQQLPEMKGRTSELDILLKIIQDIIQPKPTLKISPEHLKSYFHPFALRLMRMRGM